EKTRDGKLLLRKVMQRYVPEEITDALKQGFSAPDASWFKGDSINYVKKQLFDDGAHIYDFFDPQAVQELVSEHLEGMRNRRLLIWSLLNFEWWLRNYLS
ncbi:MAG: asparagine synthase-related protein, partial [Candidatus Hodarchaeota archaeon]